MVGARCVDAPVAGWEHTFVCIGLWVGCQAPYFWDVVCFGLNAEEGAVPSLIKAEKREKALDEALAQTFPASDPFSVGRFTSTEMPSRPVDRKAPEIVAADVHARKPVPD